jgi:hypothetical protein
MTDRVVQGREAVAELEVWLRVLPLPALLPLLLTNSVNKMSVGDRIVTESESEDVSFLMHMCLTIF